MTKRKTIEDRKKEIEGRIERRNNREAIRLLLKWIEEINKEKPQPNIELLIWCYEKLDNILAPLLYEFKKAITSITSIESIESIKETIKNELSLYLTLCSIYSKISSSPIGDATYKESYNRALKILKNEPEELTEKILSKIIEVNPSDTLDLSGFVFKFSINTKFNFFNKKLNFSGATFNEELNLSGTIFNEKVDFSKATFKKKVNLSSTIFEKEVDFSKAIFEKEVDEKKVNFSGAKFEKEVDFSSAIFEKRATFHWADDFEKISDKDRTTFKKKVDFSQAKFNANARFHRVLFEGETGFENTSFNKLVELVGATFNKETSFTKTDFLGVSIFDHTTFEEKLTFKYNKFAPDSLTSFRDANFKEELNLERANLRGILNFYPAENIIIANRGTYRIIKDQLLKQNDKIEALEYYAKEMEAYAETLELSFIAKNSMHRLKFPLGLLYHIFCSLIEGKVNDKIILVFNRYTNNYGLSWRQGLFFVICFGLLFYILHNSSLLIGGEIQFVGWSNIDCDNIGLTMKNYLEFLNPIRFGDRVSVWEISYDELKFWAYLWDFLGRIVIGIGIYQTIAAFRKLK